MKNTRIFSIVVAAISLVGCAGLEISPIEISDSLGSVPSFSITASTETKTSNDGLSTKWAASDAINVFHAVAGSTGYVNDNSFSISEEKLASSSFTGTLSSSLDSETKYDWYAFYPYTSTIISPANTAGYARLGSYSIDTNQKQSGNNSRSHLSGKYFPLYGSNKTVNAAGTPTIAMKQALSVVQIHVTNNSSAPFSVTNVVFTANTPIIGSYYIDFSGDSATYTPAEEKYVSNVATLDVTGGASIPVGGSADFYIGVKPFIAKNETLKVSVNGFTKNLEIPNRDVVFEAGKIKKISFNYNKSSATYERITTLSDVENGEYMIVGYQKANYYGILASSTLDKGRISFSSSYTELPSSINGSDENSVWTVSVSGTGTTRTVSLINKGSGKYLSYGTTDGYIAFSDESYTSTLACSSSMFSLKISDKTYYLGINKDSNYWRWYASSTLTQTNALALYKKVDTRTLLSTPSVTVAGDEMEWPAVPNAGSYRIQIGTKNKVVTSNSYTYADSDFGLSAGYYDVTVTAIPSDDETYRESLAGAGDSKIKVGTPTLASPSLSKGTVTPSSITVNWTADPNATNGYDCTISPSVGSYSKTSSSVTFTGLAAETEYTIYVQANAVSGNESWAASDIAQISVTTASASLTKLNTPENLLFENYILSWDSVSNASGYQVKIGDGTYSQTFSGCKFNMSSYDVGTYTVYVKAIGDNETYYDSEPASKSISITVKCPQYTLISNVSDIESNGEYLIATNNKTSVFNGTVSSGHLVVVAGSLSDGVFTAPSTAKVVILEPTSTANAYKIKLKDTSNYIGLKDAKSGSFVISSTANTWTFVGTTSLDATSSYNNTPVYLRSYNNNSFRSYTTKSGATFYLYKKNY